MPVSARGRDAFAAIERGERLFYSGNLPLIGVTNEWQVAGINKALASLDRGKGIAHARVSKWVASWETSKERRAPRGV